MSGWLIYGPHVAIGSVALVLYWMTILSVKGSRRHRRSGRWYLALLLPLLVSVIPISVRAITVRGGASMLQFAYLTIVLTAAGWTAWRAIRDKRDPEGFRGVWFRTLAYALTGSGVLLLAAGIATSNVLQVGLSMIGVVYGGAMIGFLGRAPTERWWLEWHLNGICLLFAATHASFIGLVLERVVPGWAGDTLHAATQVGTVAFAYLLRQWMGRRYLGAGSSRLPSLTPLPRAAQ